MSARPLHTQSSGSNERPPLRVTGVVFDSVAGVPLAGAVVQLLLSSDRTRARTVIADSLGRFGFANVEPGTWMLGFLHPRTDSLPGGAPTHQLTLRDGMGTREVTLYVPTETRGDRMLLEHTTPIGRVRGLVQDSAGRPIANARVLDADEQELTRTSETGAFSLDALPAGDVDLQVRAVGFMPQRFRLALRPDETLLLDLELDRFAPLMATVTASARR
ncbi:MAG: carboxypeptidase-like regulatory domain-containing protein, partial [Gemmatimonadaceae bacterium]|nr:carboxypeptidase-like regulatory domain-containing protein [Gemmatimonadaceae bacterium]